METKEDRAIISVLIIEDNPGDKLIINEYLRESNQDKFLTTNCSSLSEALDLVRSEIFDAVILDLGLPDSSGLNSLKKIKELNDTVPVIVLTINESDDTGVAAITSGAQDYLIKEELKQADLHKAISYSINRKKLESDLRNSLELYENTFEQAAVGIAHVSTELKLLKVNKKFCDIIGYSKKELIRKSVEEITYPDDFEKDLVQLEKLLSGSVKNYTLEKRFIHKDGSIMWTNLTRSIIYNNRNAVQFFYTVIEDITERKTLELELKQQKDLLDNIINILPAGIWITDEKGNIIKSNDKGKEIWGESKYVGLDSLKEYKGWWAHNSKRLSDEDWAINRALNKEVTLGEIINIECFDGTKKTILNSAVPLIKDNNATGAVVISNDITNLIEAEEKLKASVKEKEILIKESHHRIKNNLQLMSSLLNLSLSNIQDQNAKNILTDSLNRMVSISTLHEYLYRSSDLNEVNVQTYLYKILDHIRVSLNTDSRNVKIAKDIDYFMISSGMAISLGLIVNELVTNAVKYAFRDKKAGIINLEVKQINNNIILKIKDNGIGISENIDLANTGTLGFQITYSLVSQYNGTIDYKVDNGTEFTIEFPGE